MRNPGRFAGLLYLIGSIPGFFALLYVPSKLFVHGNPSATAQNIAAHEALFRWGVMASLTGQGIFIFVAFALYYLFKGVDKRLATMMLVLILISIPIAFLNEINSMAALLMARGADFLAPIGAQERIAWMRFFLNLRGTGYDIAGIFWGLWLFPLGLLSYRSGFIPRVIGALLMIGCFAYLGNSFASIVFPDSSDAVARILNPIQLVEMIFMLWLLIMGATPKPVTAT